MSNSDFTIEVDENTTIKEIQEKATSQLRVSLDADEINKDEERIKVVKVEEFDMEDTYDSIISRNEENVGERRGLK